MRFPHLRDTDFPNIGTVDVYEFVNEFDYTRWGEGTTLKLCNVIWNSDYRDVVAFESERERDSYFDNLKGTYEISLETQARMVPDGTIKLPLPYDVAARYNYMFVDMPIATSNEYPLDFERTDGVRRWYFFIGNTTYQAPNTTELTLIPDSWTNFQFDIVFKYVMLERGHAPVAATDVDVYLSNPIANTALLTAPDVDFGGSTIVRKSDFVPIGNGTKYLCLVSTCKYEDVSELGNGSAISGSGWNSPTYYNTADRWGYQYGVNGYVFGDGYDYSGTRTRASGGASSGGLANNVCTYAISCSNAYAANSAIETLMNQCPSFINTLICAYVVDAGMLSLGASHTIGGVSLREVASLPKSEIYSLSLKRDDFGFSHEHSRFAKLYTYPYSVLELTDNEGQSFDVRIEDTGHAALTMLTSIAFPALAVRVSLEGVASDALSNAYTWREISGANTRLDIDGGDWGRYRFDWDVPTYALYMDPYIAYKMRNANRGLKSARRNALVGYENSVRDSNTLYENSVALADTARQNVADTMACAIANNANQCNTNTANSNATCATNTANVTAANLTANGRAVRESITDVYLTGLANAVNSVSAGNQNEVTAATTSASIAKNDVNSVVGGATSMMGMGASVGAAVGAAGGPIGMGGGAVLGALSGAIIGGLTASANAYQSNTSASIVMNANTQDVNNANTLNATRANMNAADAVDATFNAGELQDTQTANNNALLMTHTGNSNTCATNNTQNTANTHNACAERTRATSNANSGYTREANVLDAKNVLENAQANARANALDGGNEQPVRLGSCTGDSKPDAFRTRGVQVRVRTQNDGAIRQAASTFARYGYALNQTWNVAESGLCPMRHFTYWKCSDIWIDDRLGSNTSVATTIESAFLRGVTVWKNPEEIGKVNPYDN